jgi:pimeloyl-ACP methyl ester carboxylesterase
MLASGIQPPGPALPARDRAYPGVRGMRTSRAFLALAGAAPTALAAPALAEDPIHDSLVYCNGSLDRGTAGAATDAEHTIVVGDPPLPPRVRRERMTVDGISTPVMQAGPRTAREAVVFIHGNPGSSRDFDSLQANNPRPLRRRFVDRMYDDFDRGTRCATLHYYRDVSNPDQMGRLQAASLRKRKRPALVVWGAQDSYVPASLAQTQKQAFPNAEIHVLNGDGHWPFVDEPQRVRALVIPFLKRVVRRGSASHPRTRPRR